MIKLLKIETTNPLHERLKFANGKNSLLTFQKGVNIISGLNGVGKTTLLNIIYSALFEEKSEGVSIKTKQIPHYFFKLKELDPRKMLDEASYNHKCGIDYVSTWLDRSGKSHGESTQCVLEDIEECISSKEPMVIIIDEPELALDARNMVSFMKLLLTAHEDIQFVVSTHHPFLLLNESFNHIELSDGLRKLVRETVYE